MSTTKSPELCHAPHDARPSLGLIAGPTASGKSDCAVRLAQAVEAAGRRAVVINADSAQVYADLGVLSARPDAAEMGGIEHRLYGAWDGAQTCSAADWAARARAEIADVHASGGIPILVGGTGLYIRTLLDGIAPVPEIAPTIRAAVRALRVADAYAALAREDAEAAARLNPNDTTRVARALEVVRSTGAPMAHWQARMEGGIGDAVRVTAHILLPDRAWLYERCDRRFALMLERGALNEVAALIARDLPPDMPVMRAIGVPELAAYLRGECGLDEATTRGAQATRNYAKRQYTWMRNQPPADWPRIAPEDFNLNVSVERLLRG
ncbi:tRNA (adenosine(37)-N6)-dimethylallyltransferase MiaA [Novosphingobium sp. FSY-8]|uniref:tRNA dimethylallyltransferase n=1 Tax=Novosphingobium ovatum TaxID=1908523 RepID=A0ABW9XCU5_9SPHN|nr:tRNA (adenosine(37)-N6)-dimethylallyltransferase MiaA [Novosphingobium ovatum]NBC36358.1 tRNA (adenosine(37)-N6)-dimethylallyltransferase MiaA [Novosphingobium ovatum]